MAPAVEWMNDATELRCQGMGCKITNVELLKDGVAVKTAYDPRRSESNVEQRLGNWAARELLMTHVNEETYGTYECRVTDIAGNIDSNFLRVIPKYQVSNQYVQ